MAFNSATFYFPEGYAIEGVLAIKEGEVFDQSGIFKGKYSKTKATVKGTSGHDLMEPLKSNQTVLAGRSLSRGLDFRFVQCPENPSCRRLAGLPRPSVARLPIWNRSRR